VLPEVAHLDLVVEGRAAVGKVERLHHVGERRRHLVVGGVRHLAQSQARAAAARHRHGLHAAQPIQSAHRAAASLASPCVVGPERTM
jgi:hypothetical protein